MDCLVVEKTTERPRLSWVVLLTVFEGDGKESRPVHASVRVVSLRIVHLYRGPTDAEAVPPGANATTRDMLRTLRSLPSFRPGIAYVLDTLYLAPTVCNTC